MPSLLGQIQAFATTILAGMLVGLLFDGYRVLRGVLRPAAAITFLTDLLFWVAATPVVFGLLIAGNWGQLRLYVVLGWALGLFAYVQFLSPAMLAILVWLAHAVGRVLWAAAMLILGIVAIPFRFWEVVSGWAAGWGVRARISTLVSAGLGSGAAGPAAGSGAGLSAGKTGSFLGLRWGSGRGGAAWGRAPVRLRWQGWRWGGGGRWGWRKGH